MNRFSQNADRLEQLAPATASSQCAWACCTAAAGAGAMSWMMPYVGSQGVPAAYSNIYQWAFEQAVLTEKRSRPGRYIEPGLN